MDYDIKSVIYFLILYLMLHIVQDIIQIIDNKIELWVSLKMIDLTKLQQELEEEGEETSQPIGFQSTSVQCEDEDYE